MNTVPSQKRDIVPLLMKDYSTFDIILLSYSTPISDVERLYMPSELSDSRNTTRSRIPFVYNISRMVCTDGHKGIEVLLMRGMDPNLKIGKYPLLYVANPKVMKVLLEYGANPNLKMGGTSTTRCSSIIHYLLAINNYAEKRLVDEKIQMLIATGLDLDGTFHKGSTLRDVLIDAGKGDVISNNPYKKFTTCTEERGNLNLFKDSQREGKIFIKHLQAKDFLFGLLDEGRRPARNYEWEKFYGYGTYKRENCKEFSFAEDLLNASTKKDFEEIYKKFCINKKKMVIDVEIQL